MRLKNFLEDILGSRSKIIILRIIIKYPSKEFTERELGRIIGIPYQSVNYSVKDFVKNNLLTVRRVGASNLYSVNKESYLFHILKALFDAESEAFHEVVKTVRRRVPSARSIQLFGSVQRGTEVPGSDIDLFIETDDKEKTNKEIAELNQELFKRFGKVVSPIIKVKGEKTSKKLLDEIKADNFFIKSRVGEKLV